VALAQVFATNTPRGQDNSGFGVLATNTPAALTTQVTLPIQQPTNAATITPSPTLAPTLSPQPVVTLTPRPLPTLLRPAAPDIESGGGTAIPSAVPPLDRHNNDLVNILLLGGDAQATNDGTLRTDTMIILSINRTTNTVALLSLPRDLYVYIPNGTMQRLNVAYFIGENIGWTDGGWGLLRQTIFYNFGINVHYYALVDFSDFEQVVDAVGGVDVAVDCAIEDLPLKGATVPQAARLVDTEGHRVLDVGYYHLSGGEALWYARSRDNSSDFDRGRRQQQILRAIWRKARTTGQLANLPTLWNDVLKVVKTNLTFEDMLGLLPIAINLDPTRIQNFLMTRTYHTTPWQTPSGDYVQLPVYDTMRSLLEDFYTPPTENQIQVGGASIIVRNGTTHSNWDVVAAERLVWDDFRAIAAGAADKTDYQDTLLIDHTGQAKGSSRSDIAKVLNVKSQNVLVQPDPNRQADFEVILGADYNSCTYSVLPVDQGSIVVTPTP
jgi:LCP family protein required for cell wall assembly